jgi:hypothetical protein
MVEGLRQYLRHVGQDLGRSESDIEPFFRLLVDNWFNTVPSLEEISCLELHALGFPLRLAMRLTRDCERYRLASGTNTSIDAAAQTFGTIKGLVRSVVFRVDCFAGPKAAVCLALSSPSSLLCSPIDGRGLTDDYIKALPCPGPIAAGCPGLSTHDLITLRMDAAGTVRSGFVAQMGPDMEAFVFRCEDGVEERMVSGQGVITSLNGEAVPEDGHMPSLDVELVFLMVRQETPEHIVERMLLFSVQVRKPFLTLEIIERLRPSAHLLGRVLMMCFNIRSIVNSACYSLTHEGNDCCQILLDKGASVSQEVAVRVSIADADEGTAHSIVLSRYVLRQLRDGDFSFRSTSGGHIEDNPNTNLWWDYGCVDGPHDIDMSDEFDCFPLQIPAENFHSAFLRCDGLDVFYTHANSSTPLEGNWLLDPLAHGLGEGSTVVVSHVDATSLVDAYATATQSLLGVAEEVRQEWVRAGWYFAGMFVAEQLHEVLQSFGHW